MIGSLALLISYAQYRLSPKQMSIFKIPVDSHVRFRFSSFSFHFSLICWRSAVSLFGRFLMNDGLFLNQYRWAIRQVMIFSVTRKIVFFCLIIESVWISPDCWSTPVDALLSHVYIELSTSPVLDLKTSSTGIFGRGGFDVVSPDVGCTQDNLILS